MADIYNSSFITQHIVRPIGLAANWLNIHLGKTRLGQKLGLDGRDVEKDQDIYESYMMTKAELVERESLPRSQRVLLSHDKGLSGGHLYLVTGVSTGCTQALRERQFFANQDHLRALECPLGSNLVFNIKTLGQFWGSAKPRVQSIEVAGTLTSQQRAELVEQAQRPSAAKKAPVARFMSPKR